MNLSRAFNNTTYVNKADLKPCIGIFYSYDFKPFLSVGSGIQYTYREGLNSSKTFNATDYSFETKRFSNSITVQSLHFVQIPIDLKFYNRFVLGIYGGFILGGNTLLKTYSYESTQIETKEKFGLSKGFENFDYGARAAYELPLTGKLNLKLGVQVGLADLTKNSYYNNHSFNNNTCFQMQLIYDFYSIMLK